MKGLYNIGNTCYMNSSVQCLMHIPELRNFFLTGSHLISLKRESLEYNLTKQWEKLTYLLCQSTNDEVINPINLIEEFLKVNHHKNINFNGFAQNDIEDFLNILLEHIHNSISKKITINITGTIVNVQDQIAYDAAKSWEKFFNSSYSHIINILYSQLLSTTVCPSCKYTCMNYEPIMSISLSIPSNILDNPSISIDDLLYHYTKEEILDTDNQWKCDKCNINVNCHKKLTFWNLSPVIIFVIKKYNIRNKLDFNFEYPMNLDMNKYCINYNEKSLKYKLIACGIHSGGLRGGHYYAICKKYSDWYMYNDACVSKIDEKNIKNNDAYCLVYRR